MTTALSRLALTAVLVAVGLAPATASAATSSSVYFLAGQQLEAVKRQAPGGSLQARLEAMLRSLLAGPTASEKATHLLTAIPASTTLRSVELSSSNGDSVATIDLSSTFDDDLPTANVMTARLAQVVFTATAFKAIDGVELAIGGKQVKSFPSVGISLSHPLDRTDFGAPLIRPGEPAGQGYAGPVPNDPTAVEERLVALKFLDPKEVDGAFDYATQQAIMAFQAWEGLQRDGIVGPQTLAALQSATPPTPTSTGSERRVEVHRDLGVVLLVEGSSVVRAVHASTGRPGLATPTGTFKVFSKQRWSWSVPFHEWLQYAAYFTGGIALHAYPDVPAYPASHGCVRLPFPEAPRVFAFVSVGTPVIVY